MTDATLWSMRNHCDEAICDAVLQLEKAVAKCSIHYSTQSKRFSIWSLVAKYLDGPVAEFLARGTPTEVAICGPQWALTLESFSGALKKSILDTENCMRDAIRVVSRCWDEALAGGTRIDGRRAVIFCDTIEALQTVIFFCASRRPKQGLLSSDPGARRVMLKRSARKTQAPHFPLIHHPYCELCWRLCEHQDPIWRGLNKHSGNPDIAPPEGSFRYCSHHSKSTNIRGKGALYRRDYNHRARFHRELYLWFRSSPESQLVRLGVKAAPLVGSQLIRTGVSVSSPEQRDRYLAYELVQAKLSRRREAILLLHWAGKSQATIAAELGLSRQTVSASLKNLPPILEVIRALALRAEHGPHETDALGDYIAYSSAPTEAGAKRLLQKYGNLVPLEAISLT